MPARNICSDQQLLDFSEEHLMYELNMLRWLADAIPNTPKGFQLSAYLESFAIHLRGLIDFLYTDPKDAKPDDVIAGDFFDAPGAWKPGVLSASLDAARTRANKEVGHITFKRKAGMDPSKPWPVGDLFNEIIPAAVKFGTEASTKKLHPKVVNWSKADSARMLTVAVSACTTTTNTAVVVVSGSSLPLIKKP
jgi:hypothetical protein